MLVDGINVTFRKRPVESAEVQAILQDLLAAGSKVMLDTNSRYRGSRSHLRLHKDAKGFFVRCGVRGSGKNYLGTCKTTLLDGEETLHAFTFASVDAFQAEQRRRWEEQDAARRAASS